MCKVVFACGLVAITCVVVHGQPQTQAQAAQAQAATAKNLQDMNVGPDDRHPAAGDARTARDGAGVRETVPMGIMGAIPPGANPFGQVPGR